MISLCLYVKKKLSVTTKLQSLKKREEGCQREETTYL